MATKILQFGEGNFLRGFFDWMVQRMNDQAGFDGQVQIIQPRGDAFKETSEILNSRGGRYHVCFRGISGGKLVEEIEEITSVKGVDLCKNIEKYSLDPEIRFVVSNTTEAGIEYVKGATTFPFTVFRFLKKRFEAGLPPVVFIPCELIDNNGEALKECILKYIDDDTSDTAFRAYAEKECIYCSTLVDRIVSGRPDPESAERYAEMLAEKDDALVCGEPFHFFAIQPPAGYDLEAELPLKHAGVNVVCKENIQPYRTRKIRFLNAAHTSVVYWGLERGFEEVAQIVADKEGNEFLRKIIFEEIYPTVKLPDSEKTEFAESVLERFANPFAHHKLSSIALNTIAKWKARCLPVVCDYYRLYSRLPECMMKGYEAIARHYDGLR